ncbi:hypothetical protein MBLNU457_1942t1 [Dothideomycetes sp. NU457]
MTERDWSIAPISKTATTTFEKFGGGPEENGRRWLRRLLFHYDSATPAQLMSLVDIHLTGKAVEWADSDKEVTELLSAKDACDATVKRFQALFDKRFNPSTSASEIATPQALRAIASRESSKERSTVQPVDSSRTTTEPAQQRSLAIRDLHIWQIFSPKELEYYRRQAAQPFRFSHHGDLPESRVVLQDHTSGTVGTSKRDRASDDEAGNQVTKKPCLKTSADGWARIVHEPNFAWHKLYQYDQETVKEYGARTLDIFNTTGGFDRKFKKQTISEDQAVYLKRAVKSFLAGLQSNRLRDKMSEIVGARSSQLSLERTCLTASEFARQDAAGMDLSKKETYAQVVIEVDRRMKDSVKSAQEHEKNNKQPQQAFQNNSTPPPAQHKAFDQVPRVSASNLIAESLEPVVSSQFEPVISRTRESVHIKMEDSDSSVISDTSSGSN